MGPTEKALTSFLVGALFARYAWKAWSDYYVESRDEFSSQLRSLGLELELPPAADTFRDQHDDLLEKILAHLAQERSKLGGDCYCLPLFVVNYMTLRGIAIKALGGEIADEMSLVRMAIDDLGIDATDEGVMALLQDEIKWIETLKGENDDVSVRSQDIGAAHTRVSRRVTDLWIEAEQRRGSDMPAIGLDYVPRYSCFISYSHEDEDFCKVLHRELLDRGVKVWYAPEAMKPGRKLHEQINAALGAYDRLLIVLSEASLASDWVDHELHRARKRETRDKVRMLFPIRLVSMERLQQWESFDADTGRDSAREIREYYIPDFSGWKDPAVLETAINQLLDGLRREDAATNTRP
jgi:hypothetical protein